MTNLSTIVQEVEAAYHSYIDVFNREDALGFVGAYCHPHTMLSGEQGIMNVQTEADHLRFYQRTMAALRERGWGHSAIDHLQVWPFSDSLAQLVADITRYKRDGSILEQGRYCYMLRRDENAWKILALAEIKAPFSGPGVARNT